MYIKTISKLFFICCLFSSCEPTANELIDKAYRLSKKEKYDEAIKIYSAVIKQHPKFQIPIYNRGICYLNKKDYSKALDDFNQVMYLHTTGSNFIITYNSDSPFADEVAKNQVSYYDAMYQRAQVNYFTDSLNSAFHDFASLVANGYPEKSNCLLWQGTICIAADKKENACTYFEKAKQIAATVEEKKEAEKLITAYCGSH